MATSDNTKDWQSVADKSAESPTPDENGGPSIAGVLEHPSYKALEEKLTTAEQLAHDNWDKALRAMSELDNVKRRSEREIERANKYGLESFAKELLPVLDSLDQAIQSCANDNSDNIIALRSGVELTLKQFYTVLAKCNIQVVNPVGEQFDPSAHEAMAMQPSDQVSPNTIITVVQKGYRLHERVLRPARVIVAKS